MSVPLIWPSIKSFEMLYIYYSFQTDDSMQHHMFFISLIPSFIFIVIQTYI